MARAATASQPPSAHDLAGIAALLGAIDLHVRPAAIADLESHLAQDDADYLGHPIPPVGAAWPVALIEALLPSVRALPGASARLLGQILRRTPDLEVLRAVIAVLPAEPA